MFNKMITLFLELKTGPSYLLLGVETLTMCWEWESWAGSQVALLYNTLAFFVTHFTRSEVCVSTCSFFVLLFLFKETRQFFVFLSCNLLG
jgi:hypothetical protein